jgi:antitoxin (DNA-binding transcriptional repressor) of toxin-antitoxin stability system
MESLFASANWSCENDNAMEFKARCLQLPDEVQRTGEELVISKRGQAVARVVAAKECITAARYPCEDLVDAR